MAILASVTSGLFFGLSWLILADGLYSSSIMRNGIPDLLILPHFNQPAILWYHLLPTIFSFILVIMLNMVSSKQLLAEDIDFSGGGGGGATCIKAWVFATVSLLMVCIGSTIWIAAVNYGPSVYSPWPGLALILNVVFMFLAGATFFAAH